MRRPPESQKEISASLSERLASAKDFAEVLAAVEEQQQAFARPGASVPPAAPAAIAERPEPPEVSRIAIWERVWKDDELFFVRPAGADPWRFWADVEQIPPKRKSLRVVLLGESVARGFLLDPHYNVAKALQSLLDSAGHADVEVVDLARSAQTFSGLEGLLQPALALEPDAYILFAGNNWHIPQPEFIDFPRLTATLRETESWSSMKNHLEELVRKQVGSFMQRLGRFSAQRGIPMIFIIPDFNLQDWQPDYAWQNPLLTGELNLKRTELIREAQSALAAGDVERSAEQASELLRLDEGSHPAGFDLLAECRLRQSDYQEARRLRESARDLALVYPSLQTAHCYSVTQNTLRQEGAANGITIVDLPQRFAEWRPLGLPDRRIFFDHVHMTSEGLRVAAACAVEKLLPLLGRQALPWTDLNKVAFEVDRSTMALAHFGAACANGTQGQERTLDYHCREAVRQDPGIADVMHAFLQVQRPNPIKYVKRFEDALGRDGFRCLKFLMRPFANLNDRLIFPDLIRAIGSALSHSVPGIEEEMEALLRQEYGVTSEGLDLLRGPFVDLTHAPLESQWWDENGHVKSYQREARFRLICSQPRATNLRLTYRVGSEKTMTKSVELLVNDKVIAQLPTTTSWKTYCHRIPAELLTEGFNSIVVQWPELCMSRSERVAALNQRLESVALGGNVREIYFSYGEIYDFWAYAEAED